MNINMLIVIGAAAIALASGIYVGWMLGVRHQRKADREGIERDVALRMNAKFDFEVMRGKADQIVQLGNQIAMAAKTANETVYKQFATPSDGSGRSVAYSETPLKSQQ